ncbi:MAG TPA: glycosyltransferase family 4 protein [Verrucomicrobiae bacterium]|nr:glycosyltransferase family 4 protein [Verrucomicrobiae bacterium]
MLANLAPALVEQGFDVTVLTTRYDANASPSESICGVQVERVRPFLFGRDQKPPARLASRFLSHLSIYPALLWRALRLPPSDVVVTMTDPPLLLLLGPIIALFKRSRLVHWAQDIYPEVAEALGVLRPHGLVAGICRFVSKFALKRNFKIVTIGRCMKQHLLHRRIPPRLLEVIPNWFPAMIAPATAADGIAFRAEHKLWGKFLVMYSGNFGLAHSFDAILKGARELQSKRPDIQFVLIGDGPRLEEVKAKIAELSLNNLLLLPPQRLDNIAETLAGADIHLVTMREELCGLVVPSKLYGVLSVGRPCIFMGPSHSEAALVIQQNQCGSVTPANDSFALVQAILRWADDPQALKLAGPRAKAAAITLPATAQAFARLLRGARKWCPYELPRRTRPAASPFISH